MNSPRPVFPVERKTESRPAIEDLRQVLTQEIETIRARFNALPEDDFNRDMVAAHLSSLEADLVRLDEQSRARGVLVFDGAPVRAGLGIQADFAAKALEHFQEAVAMRGAKTAKGAKAEVPPPLMITGTISGSFGFILEEATVRDGLQLGTSPLMHTLDEIQDALASAATGDKESFITALHGLGGANEPLGHLLDLCWKERATLRMDTLSKSVSMAYQRVADGAAWHQEATKEERPFELRGTLSGLFTLSRTFEFLPLGARKVIKGTLQAGLNPHSLAPLLDQEVNAVFSRQVTRKKSKTRAGNPVWTLVRAELVEPDPSRRKLIE